MGDRQTQVDELFRQMVLNGLDFIDHAIEELLEAEEKLDKVQSFLKYSVIHFGSGVEVLLKARLLKEHWTLIVAQDRKAPTFDQLKSGALKTVDMVQAIERLENVVGTEFPKPAKDALQEIRNHRNQAIHFRPSDNIKDVAIEQFRAWHHLSLLLKGEWLSEFSAFEFDIETIDDGFRFVEDYLEEAYQQITQDKSLEIFTKHPEKYTIIQCELCNHPTMVINRENLTPDEFYEGLCWVCKHTNIVIQLMECPDCKTLSRYQQHFSFREDQEIPSHKPCPKCQHVFTPYDLYQSKIDLHRLRSDETFSKEYLLENLSPHFEAKPCAKCHYEQPSSLFDKSQGFWVCMICDELIFDESLYIHHPHNLD
jgi:hypothetical protein